MQSQIEKRVAKAINNYEKIDIDKYHKKVKKSLNKFNNAIAKIDIRKKFISMKRKKWKKHKSVYVWLNFVVNF
jgi:hypothetical protein